MVFQGFKALWSVLWGSLQMFLQQQQSPWASLFDDTIWPVKLAYLTDTFHILMSRIWDCRRSPWQSLMCLTRESLLIKSRREISSSHYVRYYVYLLSLEELFWIFFSGAYAKMDQKYLWIWTELGRSACCVIISWDLRKEATVPAEHLDVCLKLNALDTDITQLCSTKHSHPLTEKLRAYICFYF